MYIKQSFYPRKDISMNSLIKLLQYLTCFLFFFLISTSALAIPSVKSFRQIYRPNENSNTITPTPLKDFNVSYYHQTLDHFNYRPESYTTFKQKYILYSKYWGGAMAKSPILVYFGDESRLYDSYIDDFIFKDYAARFKALYVMIEHRYYGDSIPFGMSMEDVMKNASVRGYFNSAQALADYAELILHLKKTLNAHYSPVIVLGGSYGGMLASWFRLKYPHIAIGAFAASAPVLYFDNIISQNHGYYYVVSKDFRETSEICYEIIKKSWSEIDKIGSTPDGLSFLSQKFNTCMPLKNTDELKNFLDSIYCELAQYGDPTSFCEHVEKSGSKTDIISHIHAGVSAFSDGDDSCLDTITWNFGETQVGWAWQTCSEMVMPASYGTNKDSMYPPQCFNLKDFTKDCKDKYGVLPRPHWITSYYGGHDIKLVLQRFGSNIIFSNGLRDPYSSAGVLENLSDTIIAIYTTKGTHCEDILSASKNDPEWLIQQRKVEVDIINGWIKKYYRDLKNYLK